MRKVSREMSSDWALEIMRKAPYITVSFTRADGTAYGVPLSLACASDNVWYFHCAPEGDANLRLGLKMVLLRFSIVLQ